MLNKTATMNGRMQKSCKVRRQDADLRLQSSHTEVIPDDPTRLLARVIHVSERPEEAGDGACHANAPLTKIMRVSRSESDKACSGNASSSVNGVTINDGKATGSEGRMENHVECTLF